MKIYLPGKSNKKISGFTCLSWSEDHKENIQQVLNVITTKTNFFAKSYGATILLHALQQTKIKPNSITLFGLSRKLFEQFKEIPQEAIVFQKTNDPHASYEEVKKHYPNNKIIEVSGDEHKYNIIELTQK